MTRDRIGDVPYEITSEDGKTVFRFYPKSESAKNPDSIVFVLRLDKGDREKLRKIIS